MRTKLLWVGFGLLLGCSQPKNTRSDAIEGRPPAPEEDPFFFVAIPAEAVKADTQGTIGAEPSDPTEKPSKTTQGVDPELAVQQAARLEEARREAAELRAELEVARQNARRTEEALRDAETRRTSTSGTEGARREVEALRAQLDAARKSLSRAEAAGREADELRKQLETTRKQVDDLRAARELAASQKTVPDASRKVPDRNAPENQCFSCVKICMVEGEELRCDDREDVICGWGVHPQRATSAKLAQAQCDGALDLARDSRKLARIEGSCPIATCQ